MVQASFAPLKVCCKQLCRGPQSLKSLPEHSSVSSDICNVCVLAAD